MPEVIAIENIINCIYGSYFYVDICQKHCIFDCIEGNSKQNKIHLQFYAYHIVYSVAVHQYISLFWHSNCEQNIIIYLEKFYF